MKFIVYIKAVNGVRNENYSEEMLRVSIGWCLWCKLTCPQQQHSGYDQQLSSLQLWSHTQTLHRWLI